jgi:hypothetical protein
MKPLTAIVLLGLALASAPASAQGRFGVEVSGASEFATQDLGSADLGMGLGLEATLTYRIQPHLSAYAGWGWHRFSTDGLPAGPDGSAEETGYTVGLQFAHPFGSSGLGYYVAAGGVYDHIEMENAAGDTVGDTGHGLGWQAGAGLVVPLSSRVSLTPGVRFRSLSRELDADGVTTDMDLRYVSGRVGVAATF